KEFDKTYAIMEDLKDDIAEGYEPNRKLTRDFENHCVKSKKVIDTIKEEMTLIEANQKLKKQIMDSKQLVTDPLQDVTVIMEYFAKENLKDREHHEQLKVQIVNLLKRM